MAYPSPLIGVSSLANSLKLLEAHEQACEGGYRGLNLSERQYFLIILQVFFGPGERDQV